MDNPIKTSLRRSRTLKNTLAALLVTASFSVSAADESREKPSTVQDLRYGVSLYHYFQRNYQTALIELLIAEQRGGIQGHANSGELMRGGLQLAMGMEKQASELFERVITEQTSPRIRNVAWFYLAKLRYQRGNTVGAVAAVSKVSGELPDEMADELTALQVNLAVQQGDFAGAEAQLATHVQSSEEFQQPEKMSAWLPYIYYNLGVAHMQAGNGERGVRYLSQLGDMPFRDEEHRALRDKALTAAGYYLMQQGEQRAAIDHFTRVRLQSPLIQRAMLGYGWAAFELQEYREALNPWTALQSYPSFDRNVQQAMLAIPHAYEEMARPGEALHAYRNAEQTYREQLQDVAAFADRIDSDAFADIDWLNIWSASQQQTSDDTQLVSDYEMRLLHLLSEDHFQIHAGDLRDMSEMQQSLSDWQQKLDIYRDLLQQREQQRSGQLQQIAERQIPQLLQSISERQKQLRQQLTQAEQQGDVMAVASGETKSLWQIVERAQLALERLTISAVERDEEMAAAQQQLERYQGMLLWQAHEEYPDRRWQVKKGLAGLQRELTTAQQSQQRLQVIIDEASDIAPYQMRLAQLEQRLNDQQLALNGTIAESESQLKVAVLTELEQQKQRLHSYQAQARVSLARLYDSVANANTTGSGSGIGTGTDIDTDSGTDSSDTATGPANEAAL